MDNAFSLLNLLSELLETWCSQQSIKLASADELLLLDSLSSAQRTWLEAYVALWDAT